MRTICSTGSPLLPHRFEYVCDHVKADVRLSSMSGGTDLCECLVAGDPTGSVYAGELLVPAIGMSIGVLDEQGAPAGRGMEGELVCSTACSSTPLRFWDDPGYVRCLATCFDRFAGYGHQGDDAASGAHASHH